ncbi:MAG: hypothetical protein AB1767_08735 [Bacillota bacterium]
MTEQQLYPEKLDRGSMELMRHPGKDRSLELLERGIVTTSINKIDLLGIDLIGIKQFKLVTTLDTWLNCAGLLW